MLKCDRLSMGLSIFPPVRAVADTLRSRQQVLLGRQCSPRYTAAHWRHIMWWLRGVARAVVQRATCFFPFGRAVVHERHAFSPLVVLWYTSDMLFPHFGPTWQQLWLNTG